MQILENYSYYQGNHNGNIAEALKQTEQGTWQERARCLGSLKMGLPW